MLCTKLEKRKKKKKDTGRSQEVVVDFAWEGLGVIEEMASELAFTSYLSFLVSITFYLFHLSPPPTFSPTPSLI